jgi:uncharacterized protein (TIGR03067 family)
MVLIGLILAIWSGLDYQATMDLAEMQGTWRVVGVWHSGIKLIKSDWNFTKVVFDGDEVLLDGAERSEEGHVHFLGASSGERRCDLWLNVHQFKSPSLNERIVRGTVYSLDQAKAIYRLDRTRLTLCLVWDRLGNLNQRPTDFKTEQNDVRWLYVLEWESPEWKRMRRE